MCLYVSSEHHVSICDDLVISDAHSDSLFVELRGKNGKNFVVGVIYRPPDADLDSFKTKLEEILFSINAKNKNCVLLRDFNVDLSRDDSAKNDFLNFLHSFSFFPTINTYTRVTDSTKTTIDNIITNIRNSKLKSGVILSDISDHFPVILFVDSPDRPAPSRHIIKSKLINDETLQRLMA